MEITNATKQNNTTFFLRAANEINKNDTKNPTIQEISPNIFFLNLVIGFSDNKV